MPSSSTRPSDTTFNFRQRRRHTSSPPTTTTPAAARPQLDYFLIKGRVAELLDRYTQLTAAAFPADRIFGLQLSDKNYPT